MSGNEMMWKLVPVEPTHEMRAAFWRAMFNEPPGESGPVLIGAGYDAMLAAAPQHPRGWQLLPTKHAGKAGLTHEMFDAFWTAFSKALEHRGNYESVNAGYNAMLAAAPQYKEKA